ncbi:MAG: hypothetical protein JRE43_11470, partial [Deltaproteobacteria bacterium]|nr:hypothetical protein [Deltaproteobacteria bacterium]
MDEENKHELTMRRPSAWSLWGWIVIAMGLFSGACLLALELLFDAASYLGALYILFALVIAL